MNLDLIEAQGQRRTSALLLLEVKPCQLAVVLLRDGAGLEYIVVQLPGIVCRVQHQKGDKEHSARSGSANPVRASWPRHRRWQGREGMMSMSYPARTAFFCSSILLRSRSVIFRLTVLDGLDLVHGLDMQADNQADSMSRKSASIRSFSSGARICKKETAPYFLPIRNCLPVRNSKPDGAMKSLVDRPDGASQSHSKRTAPVHPCGRYRGAVPVALAVQVSAATPRRLK